MTAEAQHQGWWSGEPVDDAPPQTVFANWVGVDTGDHAADHASGDDASANAGNAQGAAADDGSGGADAEPSRTARLALGMAVLAAERLRPAGAGAAFVTGVGLVTQTAAQARRLARRAIGPPTRIASLTIGLVSTLPGAEGPRRSLSRSRALLGRLVDQARKSGEQAVAAGRADASAFVQANVADGISWAQTKAVPQIVDALVPHLVTAVVPRLIDGAMPEIRGRVLPIVIEDLTNDPHVRDLILEQGRGAVGEAAQHLRATTASADDRVESAFRRLVRSPSVDDDVDDEMDDEATTRETPPPLGHG